MATARLLADTSFAVLDVETTGFSPLRGDRVVEIAVVRVPSLCPQRRHLRGVPMLAPVAVWDQATTP